MLKKVQQGDVIIHSLKKEIVAISFAQGKCYNSTRVNNNNNLWQENGLKVDTKYYLFDEK